LFEEKERKEKKEKGQKEKRKEAGGREGRKNRGKVRKMAGSCIWWQAEGLASRLAKRLRMSQRAEAQGSCQSDLQISSSGSGRMMKKEHSEAPPIEQS
jgi:hypothetical protein